MKKEYIIIKTLRFICWSCVLVFGLMTIIHTSGGDVSAQPTAKITSWVTENIDKSFWTKSGYTGGATAYFDIWVEATDPDGIDDITYVHIRNPEGTYWVLRDSSTGKDHYDPEGGFFGGMRRYYSSDHPHKFILGLYSVLVIDSTGNEARDYINFAAPGSTSGDGFIYSEDYTGSTVDGIEMLKRASITNATKGIREITIEFQVDDDRVYDGFVWFYDDSAEYITRSGLFKNTINSGAGIFTNGTTNTLRIQSSELELGSYNWNDIKGFHVVLQDGAQFSPDDSWEHRSISQYIVSYILSHTGSYATQGEAWDVYVSGSYAYVAEARSLEIIDVSDPSSPSLVGSYATNWAECVYVSGSYAYVGGLQIIDVSDPSKPSLVGSYNTSGSAHGIHVRGSYAYVAGGRGLEIVDVSDPSSPTFVGSYDTPGEAWDVYVSGSYAFVADGARGLQIVDVSDPSSPSFAGSYATEWAVGVYVRGSYAYVGDDGGLWIIDISDPSSPTFMGSCDTPGPARGVHVSESYAYVADYQYGLQIIDISNPSSPTLVGSDDTPVDAWGVYVSGSSAYVAARYGGIHIFRYFDWSLIPARAMPWIPLLLLDD